MNREVRYIEADVKELLKQTSPPYSHAADKENPVSRWGYFTSGPCESWVWIDEELAKADDVALWKVYALIEAYWGAMYESITNKCEKKVSALGVDWWRD